MDASTLHICSNLNKHSSEVLFHLLATTERKRKEKITLAFSYEHDCKPVSLILIVETAMQYVVLCLR